ncbi:MAG: hypothetical protein J6P05_00600 [Lachnospiraceae bacterium]|nr:hypothetical protein [Lachnospiraceae bacterium]
MKDFLYRALAFIMVFLISLMVFGKLLNQRTTEITEKLSEATLPTAAVIFRGMEINLMHGISKDMDISTMRDGLSPLNEDRSLDIIIHKYGARIDGLVYEVRSMDGSRLVERTPVSEYIDSEEEIHASLPIKDLIEEKREYMLSLILDLEDGEEITYYTRVIHDKDLPAYSYLSFAKNFSEATFDKYKASSIVSYLESNEYGDNSTFAHVDIHSSLQQVTWGDLKVKVPDYVDLKVCEMDGSFSTMVLNYRIREEGEEGRRLYNVKEYFRTRYTKDRMYLLDYKRDTDEIFNPESEGVFVNDKIMLGITGRNVDIVENADGGVVTFVANGSLYSYRNSDSRTVRVFSFLNPDDEDERDYFDNHGIRILNVDETGNIRFMVYGYMNRGRHEGEVGISVYFFNSALIQLEEELYIPYEKSWNMLKASLKKLSYSGAGNVLYIYLNRSVYRIDLMDLSEAAPIAQKLPYDSLVVSKSNRMAAWRGEDEKSIFCLDLYDGSIRMIEREGASCWPLGFMGEDLVYGVSEAEPAYTTYSGISFSPMYEILIEDSDGEVLKSYHQPGVLVNEIDIDKDGIVLHRISSGESLAILPDDRIESHNQDNMEKNAITVAVTPDRENVVEISVANRITSSAIRVVTPEEVLFQGERELSLPQSDLEQQLYYCYSYGNITDVFSRPGEAVSAAERSDGTVINGKQESIWTKGERAVSVTIKDMEEAKEIDMPSGPAENAISAALDSILRHEGASIKTAPLLTQGMTAVEILSTYIQDSDVLDLGGCSLSSVLYYVNQNNPVLVTMGPDDTLLIIGYDAQNVLVFNPKMGIVQKQGLNDSAALFAAQGNPFISYKKSPY